MRKFVAFLVCCTALSGTAAARDIPVVSYGGGVGYGSSGGHTVARGDTLAGIAKSYRLSVNEIAAANGLSTSVKLKPGQRLMIPPPSDYTVKKGDTIDLVARTFSVGIEALARANGIGAPYRLTAGQVLRVPRANYGEAPARIERAVYEPAVAAAPQDVQVLSLPPLRVETTPARATRPGVMKVSMNGGSLGTLTVKHAGGSFSEAVIRAAGVEPKTTPRPEVKPAVVRQRQEDPVATVQPASYPAPSAMPDIPERDDGRFLKPVNGPVISGYGRKQDGLYNEGINISAPKGTPVRAAENGVVVYVGDDVEGYGTLILVKHADRYVTAYAHLEKALVKEKQKIRRGQTIGTVGSSGNVDRAQLHFEIRKGREPINPSTAI